MDKISIILLILILSSCNFILLEEIPNYDINIDIDIYGDTIYEKIDCIDHWIFSNIIMKSDVELFGYEGYWQTPEEVIENKAGDCEDINILFLWLCYQYLDIKPYMLVLHRFGYAHAVSKYKNYIFADYYNDYKDHKYIWCNYYSWKEAILTAEYKK